LRETAALMREKLANAEEQIADLRQDRDYRSLEMLKTYSRDAEAFVGHAGAIPAGGPALVSGPALVGRRVERYPPNNYIGMPSHLH
jgi:hypothetical protein